MRFSFAPKPKRNESESLPASLWPDKLNSH
jgi:hypothetical protein